MKQFQKIAGLFILLAATLVASSQTAKPRLLVRSDDMASSRAANKASIDVVKNGISRSVEIMVPCAWFFEAAQLLKENPGIDIGVHLTVTSEWNGVKWGPLTNAPSLMDWYGNFPATTGEWYNKPWKLEEVEAEYRKQIEMAMKEIPTVTHISSHMGAPDVKPELKELVKKLAKEYNLIYETEGLTRLPDFGWGKAQTFEEKETAFINMLNKLEPGKTYLFVEHPAYDTDEMKGYGHKGMETVARDRNWVTQVFTSHKVMKAVRDNGIELIDYTKVGTKGK